MTPHKPSSARLLPLAGATAQPWRNGGGLTRELLTGPDASHWHWRLSVAEIQTDGPFSTYPGVQRWFAVLQGGGLMLTLDGEPVPLHAGDGPLSFDGGSGPGCRLLAGPTQDLNLMLRNGLVGGLYRAHPGTHWHACAAQGGLYSLAATVVHDDDTGLAWPVPAETLCWFTDVPARLRLEAPDTALAFWIAVGT